MNETDNTEDENPSSDNSSEEERRKAAFRDLGTEVSESRRRQRSTFFKFSTEQKGNFDSFKVESGGQWSESEADRRIREFLIRLAGDRDLIHDPDPVELARKNDLLLLFGPEEEKLFAKLAVRFPSETLERWAELLGGGDSSNSFGPRSRAERQDEKAVAASIKKAFRRRTLTFLIVVAVAVLGVFFFRQLANEGIVNDSNQALRFASQLNDFESAGINTDFGPPILEPELTTELNLLVALQEGEGPEEERVRQTVSGGLLTVKPNEIYVTIFGYNGTGQVALFGPEGWLEEGCIRASVTDNRFRPFDVVVFDSTGDSCPDRILGRDVSATCLGEQMLMIPLYIPQGEIKHSEGGTGWAEMIRIGYEMEAQGWETLAVRGTITVDSQQSQVEIPVFSGEAGEEIIIDFDDSNPATCILSNR
ncbi:MAG: Uncharacterised protein [Acidimicrobiales bacterium AG-410-I20]|nr:MAG: Uncharacterised protein [Acidimicrobiales bacterium AG-410-I20]